MYKTDRTQHRHFPQTWLACASEGRDSCGERRLSRAGFVHDILETALRATIVLLVALVVCDNVRSDDADARFLHILIVADTNDARIGSHVRADKFSLLGALEGSIPNERHSVKVLEADQATPENVLSYYRDLTTGPNDVLLFYYAGHGAIDPKFGQVLTMQTANLSRRTLVKTILDKPSALQIILTDCCSVFGEVPQAYAMGGSDPQTLRYLLFRQQFPVVGVGSVYLA
jgi:hypothetical protein